MEFLSHYGLFLLESVTVVVAILVLVAGILSLSKKPREALTIESLNESYDELKKIMVEEVKGKKIAKKMFKKKSKKEGENNPSLFVIDFKGDIRASEVEQLRDEVTAVLAVADKLDEVVIRLESPGGSVNGYGLASAQLQRIRDKKIPLTVCIDKVAASGGYLMSCVANKIIAAPFSIIGSIGVVAQLPNFHRWLKKNDIDIELITAGQYKRTLTFLGENTELGRKKFQEDLELIHKNFRDYVAGHRHELDIEKVSTGEHWLAIDAFQLKLVDSLKTSDEYLIEKMSTYNAFKVSMMSKQSLAQKMFKPAVKYIESYLGGFHTH